MDKLIEKMWEADRELMNHITDAQHYWNHNQPDDAMSEVLDGLQQVRVFMDQARQYLISLGGPR